MAFKFIDPGFGLSRLNDRAEYGFYPPLITIADYTYNRNFGVAFYTNSDASNGESSIFFNDRIDTVPEFYLKFDVYIPESASNTSTYIRGSGYTILRIAQSRTDIQIRALNDEELTLSTLTGDETYLETGRVNTFWLHVVATEQVWTITLAINGNVVFYEREGWSLTGVATPTFSFAIDEQMPMSNLIISDQEIKLNEVIVEVGNSAVETSMIEENGIYSSATAGDYVLQVLDPSSLYTQFNSDTKVSAMLAVAVPAYTTGGVVQALKCRVVDGDNVTDYDILNSEGGAVSLVEMAEEEFANLDGGDIPFMSKQISVSSDTTFASLNGLKVGWVTGF